ncbi:MAG: hypothetical protein U0X92_11600 [Anaerolineales bacterium]
MSQHLDDHISCAAPRLVIDDEIRVHKFLLRFGIRIYNDPHLFRVCRAKRDSEISAGAPPPEESEAELRKR